MSLFRRGSRNHRAAAIIVSVATTDRFDQLCRVTVRPALAPPFPSTLRTDLQVVPGAETFVLYDPRRPDECELDDERLRASGVVDERAYTCVGAAPDRGRVTLEDARERLEALDRLAALQSCGVLTDAQVERERRRVLTKPAASA